MSRKTCCSQVLAAILDPSVNVCFVNLGSIFYSFGHILVHFLPLWLYVGRLWTQVVNKTPQRFHLDHSPGAFWEQFWHNFRYFGRLIFESFLRYLLEAQNSQNYTKRAPKWKPKRLQNHAFERPAGSELDMLFTVREPHGPVPGRSRKASEI